MLHLTEGYYKAALRRQTLLTQHALQATTCSQCHDTIQSVVYFQHLTLKPPLAPLYCPLIICLEGIESL